MGNALKVLFGPRDSSSPLAKKPAGDSKGKSDCVDSDIPGWCKNTADYARDTGSNIQWDACLCHQTMEKDVQEVIAMKGKFIKDLGPVSEAAKNRMKDAVEQGAEMEREEAFVLTSFDNGSKIPKQGEPGSYIDDPRWTMELTSRVSKHVFVDADRKGAIHRRSKLANRTFYDIRGKQVNPDFGEVSNVFGFSGRA